MVYYFYVAAIVAPAAAWWVSSGWVVGILVWPTALISSAITMRLLVLSGVVYNTGGVVSPILLAVWGAASGWWLSLLLL